jgi:cell division septum initiation protein DivIVA
MSQGEELFRPRGEGSSRPSFVVALRGYDKRQVDQHLARLDREKAAVAAERDRALSQVTHLAGRLEKAQSEVAELRQRPPRVDRASFRDLGPTVDEILALAEKQATEITETASKRAADQRSEAERVLTEAWQRAERLRADSEASHERADQEAKRVQEQSVRQVEEARAEADELMEAARARAQQEVDAARTQTQQEIQARTQALTQLHGELDAARRELAQTHEDGATAERAVAQLQQRFEEVSHQLAAELSRLDDARQAADTAERHATEVRARVQREAQRVAQLAAAAVMAAAARGAETGEYPMVVPVHSGVNGDGDEPAEPAGADIAPQPDAVIDGSDLVHDDSDGALPGQRTPQPAEVTAHAE